MSEIPQISCGSRTAVNNSASQRISPPVPSSSNASTITSIGEPKQNAPASGCITQIFQSISDFFQWVINKIKSLFTPSESYSPPQDKPETIIPDPEENARRVAFEAEQAKQRALFATRKAASQSEYAAKMAALEQSRQEIIAKAPTLADVEAISRKHDTTHNAVMANFDKVREASNAHTQAQLAAFKVIGTPEYAAAEAEVAKAKAIYDKALASADKFN